VHLRYAGLGDAHQLGRFPLGKVLDVQILVYSSETSGQARHPGHDSRGGSLFRFCLRSGNVVGYVVCKRRLAKDVAEFVSQRASHRVRYDGADIRRRCFWEGSNHEKEAHTRVLGKILLIARSAIGGRSRRTLDVAIPIL
jgi:hypothetical protein